MVKQRALSPTTWLLLISAVVVIIAVVTLQINTGKADALPKAKLAELGLYIFDKPRALSPVPLKNLNDQVVTLADFSGQWSIVNFGYMSCPDICPINLSFLAQVKDHWDSRSLDMPLQVLHITFDPERDTPALLKDYLAYMHKDFIGLSGEQANIRRVAQQLNMVFIKEKTNDDGDYFISHSDSFAIISPQGHYIGIVKGPYQFDALTQALALLVEHY